MEAKDLRTGVGCALLGTAQIGAAFLGMALHLWTVVIAFGAKGFLGGIVTLIFPLIAQVYWFISLWSVTGTIANPYCLAVIAYLLLWVVMIIGVAIIGE